MGFETFSNAINLDLDLETEDKKSDSREITLQLLAIGIISDPIGFLRIS